jgi:hypothetical protein
MNVVSPSAAVLAATLALGALPLGRVQAAGGSLPLFPQPAAIVGVDARYMETVDLDGDGRLDLVVAESGSTSVATVLSTATGLETAGVTGGSGNSRCLAAADFDGDGLGDVVIGHLVTFLRGNGDGTLAAGVANGPFAQRDAIAHADLDADGDLDLVIGNSSQNLVEVYLGAGDGTFALATNIPVGGWCRGIATGDIDQDGRTDFVAHSAAGVVAVVRNLGNGAFAPPQFVSAIGPGVRLADLDGDGFPDLVTGPSPVAFRLHLGGMTFGPSVVIVNIGISASDFDVGDLDGDGDADVVTSRAPGAASIAWNDGSGSFPISPLEGQVYVAGTTRVLRVADVDGDGREDLVTAEDSGNSVAVTRQLGGGAFEVPLAEPVASQMIPTGAAHVDGDGILDLVGWQNDRAFVQLGLPGGHFAPAVTTITGVVPYDVSWLVNADVDGDGRSDLVGRFEVYGTSTYGFRCLRGAGDGTFTVATDVTTPVQLLSVHAADLDGDGDVDVAGADGTALRLSFGDGAFGFSAPTLLPTGTGAHAVTSGDVDADGNVDLVVTPAGGSSVTILRGLGAGAFGPPVQVSVPTVGVLDVGDLDLDGDDEVVATSQSFGNPAVLVVASDGGGGFAVVETVAVPAAASVLTLSVGDVTGDGRPDVVLGGFTAMNVFPGAGDGTLGAPRAFLAIGDGHLAFDADGDGVRDLLSLNGFSGSAGDPVRLNVSLARPAGPWIVRDLGKPGTAGVPRLVGKGDLAAGTAVSVRLLDARPGAATLVFLGLTPLYAPFLGGTLFPSPDLPLGPFVTDPQGQLLLPATMPSGVPARTSFGLQAWIADPAATLGVAASNGLEGITP